MYDFKIDHMRIYKVFFLQGDLVEDGHILFNLHFKLKRLPFSVYEEMRMIFYCDMNLFL